MPARQKTALSCGDHDRYDGAVSGGPSRAAHVFVGLLLGTSCFRTVPDSDLNVDGGSSDDDLADDAHDEGGEGSDTADEGAEEDEGSTEDDDQADDDPDGDGAEDGSSDDSQDEAESDESDGGVETGDTDESDGGMTDGSSDDVADSNGDGEGDGSASDDGSDDNDSADTGPSDEADQGTEDSDDGSSEGSGGESDGGSSDGDGTDDQGSSDDGPGTDTDTPPDLCCDGLVCGMDCAMSCGACAGYCTVDQTVCGWPLGYANAFAQEFQVDGGYILGYRMDVGAALTLSRLGIIGGPSANGSNVRLGVYDTIDSGGVLYPNNLVVASGDIALTPGRHEVSVSGSIPTSGSYWLLVATSANNWHATSNSGSNPGIWYAITYGMPASLGPSAGSSRDANYTPVDFNWYAVYE